MKWTVLEGLKVLVNRHLSPSQIHETVLSGRSVGAIEATLEGIKCFFSGEPIDDLINQDLVELLSRLYPEAPGVLPTPRGGWPLLSIV